jgi:hypothetical protein
MTKQQLHELWAEVESELRTLRPLFDSSPEGVTALKYFDEYLSHNELGLSLETLCDFLAKSDAPAISSEHIAQIQRLHSKMKMEDACVENLRRKDTPRSVS